MNNSKIILPELEKKNEQIIVPDDNKSLEDIKSNLLSKINNSINL